MSRKKIIIIIAIIAVLAAIAAFAVIKHKTSQRAASEPVPPSTVTVQTGDLQQRVTASGTIQAADEHSIYIELSQEVDEVFAEVGDYVEEGQILVTYDIDEDISDAEDRIESAQISIDNANLEIESLTAPADGTELLELETQVHTAQQNLNDANKEYEDNEEDIADAKDDLDYYKQMLDLGGISQSEYDEYEKTYNDLVKQRQTLESNITSCELALETAQLNLENGQNPLNDSDTQNSYQRQLNTLRLAEMELESAQNDLSKLTEASYSPISGTIIESSAEEGQLLTDATAIMKIADLTDLDIMAYVSEYDIAKIAVGQDVELTSDGIEDKIYHGTIKKIEPVAESQSTISGSETVVPVLVHLTDNDDLVKPGMEFDMEFITVDIQNADYIPVSAVTLDTETETYYVYVVGDDGIIEKREVELGVTSDMYMQLISGLEKDERILESPDTNVVEGTNYMDYATTAPSGSSSSSDDSSGSILDSVTGGGGGGMPSGGGMGGGPGGGGGMGGPR